MPYTGPNVQSQGGLISPQAAAQVSDNIKKSLAKYQADKEKRAIADGMLNGIMSARDPSGKPYIPAEDLAKYHDKSPDKQIAALAIPAARAMADAKSRSRQQQEDFQLTAADIERARRLGMEPLRTSRGQVQYAPTSKRPALPTAGSPVPNMPGAVWDATGNIVQPKAKKGDSLEPEEDNRNPEVVGYDTEITRLMGEIEKGNVAPGWDAVSMGTPYAAQVKALQRKKAAALQAGGAASPAAAATAQQQYPLGTRARRGDKWFVMTEQGWQPET